VEDAESSKTINHNLIRVLSLNYLSFSVSTNLPHLAEDLDDFLKIIFHYFHVYIVKNNKFGHADFIQVCNTYIFSLGVCQSKTHSPTLPI
jgi:hypothetical protein